MHPPDATTLGLWIVGAAAVASALVALWRVARTMLRGSRKIGHFFDDWFGEPDRPGAPGRPGIPARLSKVEVAVSEVSEKNADLCREVGEIKQQVAEIAHELHPNAGSSLRDAVNRIEARTIRLPKTSSPSHEGADG